MRNLCWCPLLISTLLITSCDDPKKVALRELKKQGVEPTGQALLTAVTEKNPQRVAQLIDAEAPLNQRDAQERTPLRIAVENKDVAAITALIKAKADMSGTTPNRVGLLAAALERGDESITEQLISAGARIEGVMSNGAEILPWAVTNDRQSFIRQIIKAGADPRSKDPEGNSLLHLAMTNGLRKMSELLIELGADSSSIHSTGETTLHQAFRQKWLDLVPTLTKAGANPNIRTADGLTLLDRAVTERNAEHISLLLKVGADANAAHEGSKLASPLLRVFNSGDPKLFQIFLDHKIQPPKKSWDTWLIQAFENRRPAIAKQLIQQGAKAHEPDANGHHLVEKAVLAKESEFVKMLLESKHPAGNAMYLACTAGHTELVTQLIALGQPVNYTHSNTQDTALNAAIRMKHDAIAALLIEKGASTGTPMREGQPILNLAIATGCEKTVQLLLKAGADPNSAFNIPISEEFRNCLPPGVIRWLLQKDTNITPLMMAADSGNFNIAKALIDAGAKTETRTTKTKMWPINFACQKEDVKMARLILRQNPHHEDRRVQIDLSDQRARIYDATGKEIFSTKVSTGRKGFATPKGTFVVTDKNRDWTSTIYHASMPYFQRLSCRDFGLHQGVVPGYPASHGCIRVPGGTASKLFKMMKIGDRVEIVP